MKSITRKILSILLSVLMMGQSLPATWSLAFAEGDDIYYSEVVGDDYHRVLFLNQDGATLGDQFVADGAMPVEPQTPVMPGGADYENEFTGWSPSIEAATDDAVYTAQYAPVEKISVTVAYMKTGAGIAAAPSKVVQLIKKSDTTVVTSPDVVGYIPQHSSVTLLATNGIVTASDGLTVEDNDTVTILYDQAIATYKVRYLFEDLVGGGYSTDASHPDVPKAASAVNELVSPDATDYLPIAGFETPSDVVGVVKADGSTVLELKYARKSGTIVFDNNGGGTLVDAITDKYGATIDLPAPERVGYTFLGWYKESAGTTAVGAQYTIAEESGTLDRTFYAKWQGDMVDYTVVYWVEKPNVSDTLDINDPTQFNFYSQTTRQAIAGTPVGENPTDVSKKFNVYDINKASGTTNVVDYHRTKSITSVNGDGTSVLNVYFKRIVFNWTFNLGSDNNGFYFKNAPGTRYTGSQYTASVKYEQDISNIWPSGYNAVFQMKDYWGNWVNRDGSWSYPGFEAWDGIFVTHRWTVTPELLPSRTFSAYYKRTRDVTVTYWVAEIGGESRPSSYPTGSNIDKTRGPVNYWKHYASQDLILGKDNGLTPKELEGFANVADDGTGSNITNYNFYYSRNQYKFSYDSQTTIYPGGFVNNVPYEKSLKLAYTGYASNWTGKTITVDGVTKEFAGWYYETDCKNAVDFNTARMPAKDLTVYAKWVKQMVLLSFDASSAGEAFDSVTYYVGDVVDSLPPLSDKQYEQFTGWYSEPGCTQKFTIGMTIGRDTTLYAGWKPFVTQYTVKYVDQSDAPISTAKVVANVNAGTVITAGNTTDVTESPVYVSGFTFESVTPSTLTLSKVSSENTIVFKYISFSGYHYTVKYLLENGDPIPGVSDKQVDTTDARVAEYYKPIIDYYPLTYIEKLDLSASDPESNTITFYYRPYQKTLITVEHWQQQSNGTFARYESEAAVSKRVGNTFTAQAKTYANYDYDYANVIEHFATDQTTQGKSYTVSTASPAEVTIKIFYYLKLLVQYEARTGGTVNRTSEWVRYGRDALGSTATANSTHYFVNWTNASNVEVTRAATWAPQDVTTPATYYANFAVKIPVTVKANDASRAYNGSALTNSGYSVTSGTLALGDHVEATVAGTITNVTAGGAPNKISEIKVYHGTDADKVDVTANYDITGANGLLTITPVEIEITANSDSKVYDGTALTNSGSSITKGSFVDEQGFATVPVSGSQLYVGSSANVIGAYTLKSGTLGANYNITPKDGLLEVTDANIPVTVKANNASRAYNGSALTNSGYSVTSGTLALGDHVEATVAGTITNVTAGGVPNKISEIKVYHGTDADKVDVTANYDITGANGLLTITPVEIEITANSDSKVYDGTALTNSGSSITKGSFVDEQGFATVPVSGSQLYVGSSANVIGAYTLKSGTLGANYNITPKDGLLVVTDANIALTVKANDASRAYNGSALTNSGYSVTSGTLALGDHVEATVAGTITNVTAGGVPNKISEIKVYHGTDADKVDVTANYDITGTNGLLTITPVEIEITANSDSKVYDGTALTNSGSSITKGSFVDEQGFATVPVSGSQLYVGSSANVIGAYTLKSGTLGANYNITPKDGLLVVTDANIALTVKANDASRAYNGSALTNSGYSVTSGTLALGDHVEATVAGTITNVTAGGVPNKISEIKVYHGTDADKVDVTANYDITGANGLLTITPVEIEITANSDSKVYDGTALTNSGSSITKGSFVDEQGFATVPVSGSQLYVGSSANVIGEYTLKSGTLGANYNITPKDGLLVVTDANIALTVKANDASRAYNGSALTNSGYSVTSGTLALGDHVEATVAGTITNVTAGGVPNKISEIKVYHGTDADKVDVTANYDITGANGLLTITPVEIEITANSDSKVYDGTALTNSGSSITKGSFVDEQGFATVPVSGSQLYVGSSANVIGAYTLKSGTLGANYNITPKDGLLVVTDANIALTVKANDASRAYNGSALTNSGYSVTSGTLALGDHVEATVAGTITNVTAGGAPNKISEIKVYHGTDADKVDVTANYDITGANGLLTITPVEIEITANSDSKVYDGTALTNSGSSITKGSFVDEQGFATVPVSGSQLYVGSSANVIGAYTLKSGTLGANYNITPKDGLLVVTDANIALTVKANDASRAYNGSALTNSGYSVTSGTLALGDHVEATVAGTITNVTAGGAPNKISEIKVYHGTDADKVDVTANYDITGANGLLTITPVEIEITANSDSKVYDGTALTNSGSSITKGSFVGTQGFATVPVNGSQLYVGSSANVIGEYTLKSGTLGANYNITPKDGLLEVTDANIAVTVKANDASRAYNGSALTNSGYSVTSGTLALGDHVEATVAGTITNVTAGGAPNKISEIKVYHGTDADKVDVTANYDITGANGLLTITPVEIEITANSDSKVYDGTALTNSGSSITKGSFVDEQGFATVPVSGSQLYVGSSANVIGAYTLKSGTLGANYNITPKDGLLVVTDANIALTVKANDASRAYNGSALTNSGYSVTSGTLALGDHVEATVAGTITNVTAGGVPNKISEIKVYHGTDADKVDVTANYDITGTNGLLTITPVEIEITANSDSKVYDGTALTNSGSSITKGSFVDEQGFATVPVSGSQLYVGSSANVIGEYTLKSGTLGANYNITPKDGLLVVTDANIALTVKANDASRAYNGSALTNSGYSVTSGTLALGDHVEATVAGTITNVTAGGVPNKISEIKVYHGTDADKVDVTANYDITGANGLLTITPVEIEITANSDSKVYDGTALTNSGSSITKGSFVDEQGFATVPVSGSQLYVGSSANVIGAYTLKSGTLGANYNITPKDGLLVVTDANIALTVKANDASRAYNGSALTNSGYSVTSGTLALGDHVEATVAGTITNVTAGGAPNKISEIKVYHGTDADKVDVTANYDITGANGLLTITPVEIEITANSDSKVYDGTALTNSGSSITKGSFVDEQGFATVPVSGSQLYVGSSANVIGAYTLKSGTLGANYNITPKDGLLVVTDANIALTVKANDASRAYNGSALTNSGYSVTSGTLALGDHVEATVAGTITNVTAGGAPNKISEIKVYHGTDADKVDVTANYDITGANGLLTITPVEIEITANSDSKVYDGTALTNSGSSITKGSFVDEQGFATVPVNGSQLYVGSSANVIGEYTLKSGTLGANYNITPKDGLLEVTDANIAVTVKANDASRAYNGSALTNSGYSVTSGTLALGDHVEATVAGTITNVTAGGAPNKISEIKVYHGTDADKVDVTANYDITGANGLLTITPVEIEITANSDSKVYDGTALTNSGSSITKGSFVGTQGFATVPVNGSQLYVGSSANVIGEYTLKSGTLGANYNITPKDGLLEVTDANIAVTVKANDASRAYNGSALTNSGYSVTSGTLALGDHVEATVAGTITNVTAGGVPNKISEIKVYHGTDADKVDVTANYDITGANGLLTITPVEIEITANSDSKVYDGTALTNSGSSITKGSFVDEQGFATVPVSGSQLYVGSSANVIGAYTLKSGTLGANYNITPKDGLLVVTDANIALTVKANDASRAYNGSALTNSGYSVTSGTLALGDHVEATVAGTITNVTAGGAPNKISEIKVYHGTDADKVDVTANYDITGANGLLTITPVEIEITANSDSKVYDGTALTNSGSSITKGSFVDEQGFATVPVSGSQLYVGSSANVIGAYTLKSGTLGANYNITPKDGLLVVTDANIALTVKANDASRAYNGSALTNSGYSVTSGTLALGDHVEATVAGTITNVTAGGVPNKISEIKVYHGTDADKVDVTANYDITGANGLLTITPVEIEITANSDSKVYDGTALTNSGSSITKGSFVGTQGFATVPVNGSQLYVGSSANVIGEYTLKSGTLGANYNITPKDGLLVVTDANIALTVKANDASRAYNGSALTNSGYSVTSGTLALGDHVEATVAGTITNVTAGGVPNKISEIKVYHGTDADKVDVTANYDITGANGLLTITPVEIEITANSDSKVYDGTALTNSGSSITKGSFVGTQGFATVPVNGSQLYVGSSANVIGEYTLKSGTLGANYNITPKDGLLVVTDANIAVTVKANDASRAYNGSALTNSGYSVTSGTLALGDHVEATVAGTITNVTAGGAPNKISEIKVYHGTDADKVDVTANYDITGANGLLTITPVEIEITANSDSKVYDGTALTNSGSSITKGSFVGTQGFATVPVNGSQLYVGSSANVIGEYTLKSGTLGANYNITPKDGLLEVTDANIALTVKANDASRAYNGSALTNSGYSVTSGTLALGDHVEATVAGTITNVTAGGAPNKISEIKVYHGTDADKVDVTANYDITGANGLLTITPVEIEITANSDSKVYDGTALTNSGSSITKGSFVGTQGFATVPVSGSQLYVGSSANVIGAYTLKSGTLGANYNITPKDGLLEVTDANIAVTVKANDASRAYNGSALTNSGYSVTSGTLALGDHVEATVAGTITNVTAGGAPNKISEIKVYHGTDADKVDVTANYDITGANGLLTITPVEIEITANSDSKVYDGTALTNSGSSITKGSFVGTQGFATVPVNGSQLYVGSSANVIGEYTLKSGTLGANYNITPKDGLLEVTDANIALTVKANDASRAYNGSALTNSGYSVTSGTLALGDHVEATVAGTITNVTAGGAPNKISEIKVYHGTDADKVDVTANYDITGANGLLTITPVEIEITANSDSKVYDGTALTNSGSSITKGSFVGTQGFATVPVNGSQLYVGSSANVIGEYTLKSGTLGANYNITPKDGLLVVTDANIAVTVKANDASRAYNGSALTNSGYSVTSGTLALGDHVEATVAGTITNVTAGGVPNKISEIKVYHGTDADKVDVTANYDITGANGLLTITPVEIEITANSDSKVYDGTALTNSGSSITKGSFVDEQGFATVPVSGSQLYVGSSANVIGAYTLKSGTLGANYNITPKDGLLVVTDANIALTVKANDASRAYNGSALTNSGYSVTSGTLALGDHVEATVAGTITNVTAGGVPNKISEIKVYHGTDADKVDVTANYDITGANGLLTITPVEIEITANSDSKVYDGTALTNSGSSITKGSFVGTQGFATVPVNGSQLYVGSSANVIGEYTLKSGTLGANYNITPKDGLLEVTDANIAVTVKANDASRAYNGSALTNSGYSVTSGTLALGDHVEATVAGTITNVTAGGAPNKISEIKVYHGTDADKVDVTANYDITGANGLLTITPVEIEITANSDSKVYDGTALTNSGSSITKGSFVGTQGFATVPVSGSQLYVGSSANVIGAYTLKSGTLGANYNITPKDGLLEVTDANIAVTVKANDASRAYNGSALTNSGYSVTSGTLALGDHVEATVAGTITNVTAGGAPNKISEIKVYHGTDADKVDVTANYDITGANGLLTITPVEIEITANSDSKVYDGTALTNSGSSITKGSFVGTQGFATVPVNGSQLYVGSSANVIGEYTLKSGTLGANYNITPKDGLLEVTDANIAVTVKANDASRAYNGSALTNSGYSVTSGTLALGDHVEATVAGTITNVTAGGAPNKISEIKVYHGTDADKVDVTANYDITGANGLLTITPVEIEITANSDSKVYDGTALTNSGSSITKGSFVGTQGFATVPVNGSQLYVGSSANVIGEYTLKSGTLGANYNITPKDGLLEVTDANIAVTVKANDASRAYNGSALTNSGYSVTSGTLALGDHVEATVAGTITNVTAGGAPNKISEIKVYHGTDADKVDVTANYDITGANGLLTITPVEIEITAGSLYRTYDGFEHSVTTSSITSEATLLNDATYEVTFENNTRTDAGSQQVTVKDAVVIGDLTANYAFTYKPGTLQINKKSVTITAKDKTYWYNALVQGPQGATFEGIAIGDQATWTPLEGEDTLMSLIVAGGQKNAGTYADELTPGTALVKAGEEDVTGNYELTYAKGDLTINKRGTPDDPKGPMTITAKDKTYWYNALVQGPQGATFEGIAIGDQATWTPLEGTDTLTSLIVAGGQKNAGTYADELEPATALMKDGDEDVTGNYELTYLTGDLTINKRGTPDDPKGPMTITATDKTYWYNALVQGPQGATFEGIAIGDQATWTPLEGEDTLMSLIVAGGQKNAGTYTDELVPGTALVKDGDEDVTGNYELTYAKGDMTISIGTYDSVKIRKVWDYGTGDTTDSPIPDSVHVTLMAGTETVGDATLTAPNWAKEWTGLPTHTDGGNPIYYTAYEDGLTGYDVTLSTVSGQNTLELTITNTLQYFTVTFVNYNGTVLKKVKVPYGGSTTTPGNPKRTNYTFNGWTGGSWLNVTSDQIIRTSFTTIEDRTTELTELGIPLAGGTVTNVGDSFD